MPERVFFNFLNFLAFFFGISLHGSSMNGIQVKNFFFSFSAYLILFWLKIMLERVFLISWIFLRFFLKFSGSGRVWTEFVTKIISLFLGLYYPVLAKNNAGKGFSNFLNFLTFFFSEFPCTGRVWTEFRNKLFFSLSIPLPTRFA